MNDETTDAVAVVEETALSIISRAEIDTAVSTAKKYPRSLKRFREDLLSMVTLTEEIASGCIYAVPRGNKTIEGPSVRFAEAAASAWGNCRAGARIIGEEGDFVIAQGVFADVERNNTVTFEVKRRITDRNGRRFNADMIAVTSNAACSIALRNAILRGVPKAFWADIYDDVRKTAIGTAETLVNRRAKAVEYLQKFGVTLPMICARLGVGGVEDIGLDQLSTLKGLATALKDGDTTVEKAFATPGSQEPAKGGMEGLKERLTQKPTPNLGSDAVDPALTDALISRFEDLKAALESAPTLDETQKVYAMFISARHDFPAPMRDEMRELNGQREAHFNSKPSPKQGKL